MDIAQQGAGSVQAKIYRTLTCRYDDHSFCGFLRWHDMRHFRKLKVPIQWQTTLNELCDKVVEHAAQVGKNLRNTKDKYGALSFVKCSTDSLCTPGRFGIKRPCPICNRNSFKIAHLACCEMTHNFIRNLMQDDKLAELEKIIPKR